MYGQKFSKIRIAQNMSLEQTCDGITSKSSLSRWENGTGSMDADKVALLLKRLNVNTAEFFAFQYDEITQKVGEAYYANDIDTLKKYTEKSLANFHKDPNSFLNLFNASITCNGYLDLTNINLFTKADLNILIFKLSNTYHWTQELIDLFGGSILLLPSKKIYSIAGLIIDDFERIRMISDFQISNTYEMLLNAVLSLIEKRQLSLAHKLFNKLDQVSLGEHYSFTRIRKKFCHALIAMCENGTTQEIKDLFVVLRLLDMNHTLSDYRSGCRKIQKIYRISY